MNSRTPGAIIDPNTDPTIGAEVTADLVHWFDDPVHVVMENQGAAGLLFRDLTAVSPAAPLRAIRLKLALP